MLPKYNAYGQWPASGEIDIMESRGNDPGYEFGGRDKMGSTCIGIWTPDYIQTYIDDPSNVVLNVTLSDFWGKGGFESSINNPWAGGCDQAPFDQEFYLVMNVAVGGTNGYFPGGAPWSNTSPHAPLDFWKARDTWQKTWAGEDVVMKIDKVTVWELC
ncbi:hypothetical protein HDU76_008519 [Blyttiomyces sp. JEL0837]|nr:hypothetical protein HDU76_008519 [Blyttiomyces sp. JEL0837]